MSKNPGRFFILQEQKTHKGLLKRLRAESDTPAPLLTARTAPLSAVGCSLLGALLPGL